MKIELRQGWHWPASDIRCWDYMQKFPDLPQKIKSYVKAFDAVIQAGGNAGFYTKQYASMFQNVYVFEPDYLNFACLVQNVTEPNVMKLQSCLGNNNGPVGLNINQDNRGKNFVQGSGSYPMLRIDDLALADVRLIHLDIEGYEYNALLGGIKTIEKCRPTVVVEIWPQLDNRFGQGMNQKTKDLMSDLGYRHVDVLDGSDWVFVP